MLRVKAIAGLVLLGLLLGGIAGRAGARAVDGCRPLRAVFYAATGSLALAQALAADQSACAEYSVSVPPLAADKTQMRSGVAGPIRALGPNFHAIAEVSVNAWAGWVSSTGASWYDAGVEARRRMAAAGFDVAAGDSWVVNEFSSAVRTGTGATRQNMRDLVHGLYDGDGGPSAKGVVLVVGLGQPTAALDTYKAHLESWLQDAGFWADMGSYVVDFLQENYGDVREYGVAGADVPTRLGYLNAFLEHEIQLASVAPATGDAARQYLEGSYAALANAAWAWSSGFGYTAVPYEQMEDFVSAQIDAMRSYDASLGWSSDRIGFAWDPNNSLALSTSDFDAETASVRTRLADAIAASDDPAAPGAGACATPWCTATVPGAAFTQSWSTFSSWTPTGAGFGSGPLTVTAGSVSGPMTIVPEVGSVVTALPVDTTVHLSSSSPGGSFSISPTGPWTSGLDVTIPAGSTSVGLYMLDTQVGTPTVTARVGSTSSTQAEIVTAPAAPLALGGGGNSVVYAEGGAPVAVDPALSVTDAQSSSVVSASASIESGFEPGDLLTALTAGTGISAAYANGILTLTGTASLASYQTVLESVAFSGASTAGGARTVIWAVNDGATTASAVSTIVYTAPPSAPVGTAAGSGDGQATVSFDAPASNGGAEVTSYTVTASPGGQTATGAGSPITVGGLANGTTYSFTVTATNPAGTGPASAASNPVTPSTPGGGAVGSGGGGGGGGGGGAPPNLHVGFNGQPAAAAGNAVSLYVAVGNTGGIAFDTTLTVTTSGLGNVGVATLWGFGQGCTASGATVTCDLVSLPSSSPGVQVALLTGTVSGGPATATATLSGTVPGDSDTTDDHASWSWSPPASVLPTQTTQPRTGIPTPTKQAKTFALRVRVDPGRQAGSVQVHELRTTAALHGSSYLAGRYPRGTKLRLTAAARPGWRFDRWRGPCAEHKPVCTFKLRATMTATAVFAPTRRRRST